jgi:NTE family protein
MLGWMLSTLGAEGKGADSDLASYLLFDGSFADRLIELGRRDTLARADDVRAFFDGSAEVRAAG